MKRIFESAERKAEDHYYVQHLADDTRLSRRQAASIFRHVEEISAIAGMQTPRVFLNTHHEVNASALGQHNPILTLHSALVDQFTEAQLRAVIAHELGHIKCQHTFYKVVTNKFAPIAAMAASVPGGSLIALALQWHLNDWSRKAELSADRFGLLVTDDLETVQTMLIQLAGGASIVGNELSTDEFREQAAEFRSISGDDRRPKTTMEKIEYYVTELILNPDLKSHPWPAIRFVELEEWACSPQYALLREGNLVEAEKHPFQYMPDTVPDEDLDTTALDGSMAAPVLRQAAAEVAGKWKTWSTKVSTPATSGVQSTQQQPAGWYPDPQQGGQFRWWDGSSWTAHTQPK
ncbi:M48 family metalloprotease [Mycolicibacterium monacense]|uniref:M48 family metalloprotease n=1 Tax=Mycolicibacterium monacense TaxID=85693 RepID=UPI0007EB8CEF|nr:M48 family metalloprotease [Mycolicibacterium monacense]OBF48797.1 hypothetical protein A5778_22510 [Mycolicibacterium monacense]